MKILSAFALLVGLAIQSSAGYFYGPLISTNTGTVLSGIAGTYYLAAGSGSIATPTIILDGQTGNIVASSITALTGIKAATGTFTASGANQFSLYLSSGINAPNGTVKAGMFSGDGSLLSNVSGNDPSKVLKTGDTMTGQLILSGSSLTVGGVSSFAASLTAASSVTVVGSLGVQGAVNAPMTHTSSVTVIGAFSATTASATFIGPTIAAIAASTTTNAFNIAAEVSSRTIGDSLLGQTTAYQKGRQDQAAVSSTTIAFNLNAEISSRTIGEALLGQSTFYQQSRADQAAVSSTTISLRQDQAAVSSATIQAQMYALGQTTPTFVNLTGNQLISGTKTITSTITIVGSGAVSSDIPFFSLNNNHGNSQDTFSMDFTNAGFAGTSRIQSILQAGGGASWLQFLTGSNAPTLALTLDDGGGVTAQGLFTSQGGATINGGNLIVNNNPTSLSSTTINGRSVLLAPMTSFSSITVTDVTGSSSYALALSSGISAPNGTIVANMFVGDGTRITGITAAAVEGNTFTSSKTFTSDVLVRSSVTAIGNISGSTANFTNANISYKISGSSAFFTGDVAASFFAGDGSKLTNLPSAELNTFTSSKTFTSAVRASSITLTGTAGANMTVSSNIYMTGGVLRFPDGTLQNTAATSGGGGSTQNISSQTFNASGTWTRPAGVNNIHVFCVGGGGGGEEAGGATAGGGGGGAVINEILSVSGDVTVTIGAGGAAGFGCSVLVGSQGSDTTLSGGASLTCGGGGAGAFNGGHAAQNAPANGGGGGGGGGTLAGGGGGGAASEGGASTGTIITNIGGTGVNGMAGGAGEDRSTVGGNGGYGVKSPFTNKSPWYGAGGGGGGSGGGGGLSYGGGAGGNNNSNGSSAPDNSGGGGGGGGGGVCSGGGVGGSGLVVIVWVQ